MLNEISNIQQIKGESTRRWFYDKEMDLTLWLDGNVMTGFQLTYDRTSLPYAITWISGKGYSHNRVDDGECIDTSAENGIPILLPDGVCDTTRLISQFIEKCKEIDADVSSFVIEKLQKYNEMKR